MESGMKGERTLLDVGEYALPRDCRAVLDGGIVRVVGRSRHRLSEGEFRCRDCRHFGDGHSVAAWYTSKVCRMKPKTVKYGRNAGTDVPLFYSAQPYGKPCPKFERADTDGNASESRANGQNTPSEDTDV